MVRLHPGVERLLIVIFLGAIALPVSGLLLFGSSDATTENRTLSARPAFPADAAALRAFPGLWSRYFEDHFALRSQLVRWQAEFRLKALGVSASEAVIHGRDGWLFYADDGAMKDYADTEPFTDVELETWRETLQDTNDWLAERGIAYLFVIAPDKHLVYPEYMPETIRKAASSRIDQLVGYLHERSTVRVLDLRPALMRAKAHERIYHRTDTHWNDRGAFVGYAQIVDALSGDVPGLTGVSRAEFTPRAITSEGRDLAGMMGLTSALREDDLVLEPRHQPAARIIEPTQPDPTLMHARIVTVSDRPAPRAVVFMDSFGVGLVRFLSEHFSRTLYLWQHNVDLDVVRDEQPQVVIQEWVGRRLSTVRPYNPVPPARAAAMQPSPAPGEIR